MDSYVNKGLQSSSLLYEMYMNFECVSHKYTLVCGMSLVIVIHSTFYFDLISLYKLQCLITSGTLSNKILHHGKTFDFFPPPAFKKEKAMTKVT